MGKYGETAVRAVRLYANGKASSIVDVWEIVARETLTTESTQKKPCPRSTFLGVCESGIVVGVPAGGVQSKPEAALGNALAANVPFLLQCKSSRFRHFAHFELAI